MSVECLDNQNRCEHMRDAALWRRAYPRQEATQNADNSVHFEKNEPRLPSSKARGELEGGVEISSEKKEYPLSLRTAEEITCSMLGKRSISLQ